MGEIKKRDTGMSSNMGKLRQAVRQQAGGEREKQEKARQKKELRKGVMRGIVPFICLAFLVLLFLVGGLLNTPASPGGKLLLAVLLLAQTSMAAVKNALSASSKREGLKSGLDFVLYALFLMSVTLFVPSFRIIDVDTELRQHVRACLGYVGVDTPNSRLSAMGVNDYRTYFGSVRTVGEVWKWLDEAVVNNAYTAHILNETGLDERFEQMERTGRSTDLDGVEVEGTYTGRARCLAHTLFLVEPVRLRMKRIQPDTCVHDIVALSNPLTSALSVEMSNTELGVTVGGGGVSDVVSSYISNNNGVNLTSFLSNSLSSTYASLLNTSGSEGGGGNLSAVANDYISSCYGEWDEAYEDTSNMSAYSKNGNSAFAYTAQSQTRRAVATRISGKLASYAGGAYTATIPLQSTAEEASAILKELKEDRWLDESSRVLIVDMQFNDRNNGMSIVLRFLVEFSASADIATTMEVNVMETTTLTDDLSTITLILSLMGVIFLVVDEMLDCCDDKLHYFKEFWNYFDLLVIGVLLAGFVMYMVGQLIVPYDPQSGMVYFRYASNLAAADVCIGWVKMLKYTTKIPRVNHLALTLGKVSREISLFLVVIATIVFGFAQALVVISGDDMADFRSYDRAIASLLRSMLTDLAVMSNFPELLSFGSILFLTFSVMMVFIIVNIFISILSDMYIRVKVEETKRKTNFPLFLLLKAIRNMVEKIENKKAAVLKKLHVHHDDEESEGEGEGEEEGMFGLAGDEARILAESIRSLSGDHDGLRYSVISQLNSDAQLQQVLRNVDGFLKKEEEAAINGATAREKAGRIDSKNEGMEGKVTRKRRNSEGEKQPDQMLLDDFEEEEESKKEGSEKKVQSAPLSAPLVHSELGVSESKKGSGKAGAAVVEQEPIGIAEGVSGLGGAGGTIEGDDTRFETTPSQPSVKTPAALALPPSPSHHDPSTTTDSAGGPTTPMTKAASPLPLLLEEGATITREMIEKVARMEAEMQKLRAGLEEIVEASPAQ